MLLHLGLGSSVSLELLDRSMEEARRAAQGNRTVVRYRALPTVQLILDRLSPADARTFVELIESLSEEGLVETLHAFLIENATWGAAASRLGGRRQTLSARIGRIETITALSMSSADDRVVAWMAPRART